MRGSGRDSDKIPYPDDPLLVAYAELDLPLDEVEEMVAARVRVACDPVFQAVNPDVHGGGLRQCDQLKPVEALEYLMGIDLDDAESELARTGGHREGAPEHA